MPERGDLLLAAGGAGGDRAMESAVQHGTAPFVTGLQAPGTRSNLAAATGAWRYGKRSAFPTSPHPRRRRTNVERRGTLTFHLVQKICQVSIDRHAQLHRNSGREKRRGKGRQAITGVSLVVIEELVVTDHGLGRGSPVDPEAVGVRGGVPVLQEQRVGTFVDAAVRRFG